MSLLKHADCGTYFIHRALASAIKPEMAILLKPATSGLESTARQAPPHTLLLVFSPPSGMGEDKECLKIHRSRALTLGLLQGSKERLKGQSMKTLMFCAHFSLTEQVQFSGESLHSSSDSPKHGYPKRLKKPVSKLRRQGGKVHSSGDDNNSDLCRLHVIYLWGRLMKAGGSVLPSEKPSDPSLSMKGSKTQAQ